MTRDELARRIDALVDSTVRADALVDVIDAAHVDTALVDTAHVDTAHVDTAHVDTAHVDTALVDTALVDTALVDTALVDTALVDTAHVDTALEAARDRLLVDLRAFQAARVAPYARLVKARGAEAALPTDVFRYARVAAHPPDDDVRVFRTSGTTSGARGQHFFRDLSHYDRAARTWAKRMLFPDVARMRLVVLAPHEDEAPDSSLSYMLSRFVAWFGADATFCFRGGALDLERLERALTHDADAPIALLGTSFAFVFADDALTRRFALPPGSRVMQTGGFKGRTRELDPDAMRAMLRARYGVPDSHVVAEYGMTELSSQAYETTLAEPDRPRRLRFPPWVRVRAVDPVSLAPLPTHETGILRIEDAANLDSVCTLQTADLARVDDDGAFVLFGRAPGATPRGCSLAVEEALAEPR